MATKSTDILQEGWRRVLMYGAIHLLVDVASISFYLLLLRQAAFSEPLEIFLLYIMFAFATQAPLGYLADRFGCSAAVAVLGCLFVAIGTCLSSFPLLGLLILGIGNAMFHVGGGIVTLSLSQSRATLLGIFVAPGTLGIAIGTTLGAANRHPALIFAGLLVFATIVILMAGHPSRHTDNMDPPQKPPSKFWDLLSVAILLLCATVALRQIVGSFGGGAAKEWLYAVPIAVFLGKILGGILADRFGWHRFTVVVILLSAPLLFCASTSPLAGVVGSFLFTMSMPVTLAALAVLLPGRPGTAFGIASLALAFGGFACLFIADDHWTLFALVCLTAYLFHVGMLCYNERVGVIRSFSE